MVIRGMMLGVVFGLFFASVISFVFMFIGQGLAGGFTSIWGESWLYYATVVPFIITFVVLGIYFANKEVPTNKKMWILSFVSALFITWYSATIGTITGEYIVRGLIQERENIGVNEMGILGWGSLYALIALPFATPIARLLIELFYNLLKKFKVA